MPKNIASETIKIPTSYNSLERKFIARDIIEYVIKRTKKGRGKGDKAWTGSKANQYSKSYKESLDFKLKASKGKVNLTLSGDMLTAISLRSEKKGELKIGIPTGDPEWGRAKGNIIGSYGRRSGHSEKARPFLSLSNDEIKKILAKYPLKKEKRENKIAKLAKQAAALKDF